MKYYSLAKYIDLLKQNNLLIDYKIDDKVLEKEVKKVSYNSKDVDFETLYICKGLKFKKEYLEEAVTKNILAYVCEKENQTCDYPYIIVKDIRESLAVIAAFYYNDVSQKIKMIGITGTKGKSTTAYYVKSILDEVTKEENAIASSIDTYDGKNKVESLLTSPESLDLQRYIYNAWESKIDNFIMEVSSQALKYKRVYGVMYDVAVFLNIGIDHISKVEHPDFEDYFASKLKIFKQTKNAVINLDSDEALRIKEEAKQVENKVLTFSMKDKMADIYAYDIKKESLDKISFKVKTPKFNDKIILNMPGLFNIENALAAIGVALILDVSYKDIFKGLEKAKASGRMEAHSSKDKRVIAIVDYAHNRLSFEKLYESVKEEYPTKKIVTVFGCPGGKAFIRRQDLGLLSGQNSDITYLTAEDPGLEDVKAISEEIAGYIKEVNGKYEIIEDRGEAIKEAIKNNVDSVILITGKGNETRQKYGSEYLPYKSDTYYVLEALREYDKSSVYIQN